MSFKKNVFILITGSSIVQLINLFVTIIFSRIFSAENYGVLGIYLSTATILSIIVTGRYDMSIIEPKDDIDGDRLMKLSAFLSFIFSILSYLIIFIIYILYKYNILIYQPHDWFYYLPITVCSLSLYSAMSFWLNRKKFFKKIIFNKLLQLLMISICTYIIYKLEFHTNSLIIGHILGLLSVVIYNIFDIKMFNEKHKLKELVDLAKRYIKYPKYLLPSTLASELSSSLPIYLISSFFSSQLSGYYFFTLRIVSLPISLFGNSIGEVYRQEASVNYSKYGDCSYIYLKTLKKLILLGTVPLLLFYFLGEYFVPYIWGSQWEYSGRLTKYFSFLIFFQFISTPLSYTIHFNRYVNFDTYLQLFRLIFTFISFYIGYILKNFDYAIINYVFVYSVYYILHSIYQYKSSLGI